MNVLIARTQEECTVWKDTAVVVDVLRTTATVCALLGKGARPVMVCADAQTATRWKSAQQAAAVFSEQKLDGVYEDNSPYLATKLPAVQQALVVETDTGLAAEALRAAGLVLLGGFCNFHALVAILRAQKKDVLLVPASLFGSTVQEEDLLCAEGIKNFLQGIGTPQAAVEEFGHTVRFAEFRSNGPRTASKDLNFSLGIDGFPFVPQATAAEGGGVLCLPYGEKTSLREVTSGGNEIDLSPLGEDNSSVTQPSAGNPAAPQAPSSRTSRLKGFFSDLVRAAKEEKQELEESIRQTALKHRPRQPSKVDDPMDTLLKKSAPPAPVSEDNKPVHISDVGENPVEKNPFGQRSISLESEAEQQPAAEAEETSSRIHISKVETDGVKRNEFGKMSVSLGTKPLTKAANSNAKKAIVLFSGGLDSTTCLYWALNQGYTCEALTVFYGQRHAREVEAARQITRRLGVKHHQIELNLPWLAQASSLVNAKQPLPDIAVEKIPQAGIPSTYVPGRNLMFLSIAGSLLDSVQAQAIIAGPNAVDFSGYPDCTPAFFKSAAEALNRGTQRGVQEGIEVLAPLMRMSKAEIVKLAAELKVPFELTWSCYAGGEKPCGHCDSCKLRAKGFAEAGVHDTALD